MVANSYTVAEARDFMYQTWWAAWNDPTTGWRAVLPETALLDDGDPGLPQVIWDALEPDDDTPVTTVEAYVAVRHVDGQQASLRGESGRRWRRTGFVLTRMRFPVDMELKTADALSKVVNDAFQGKRGVGAGSGILFPKVRPVERGQSDERNRQDVIANFEYDEIS